VVVRSIEFSDSTQRRHQQQLQGDHALSFGTRPQASRTRWPKRRHSDRRRISCRTRVTTRGWRRLWEEGIVAPRWSRGES